MRRVQLQHAMTRVAVASAAASMVSAGPPCGANARYLQNSLSVLKQALRYLDNLWVRRPVVDPRIPTREEYLWQEAQGSKALLLEIVRRAAYDWVLYRNSRRLQHKKLAEDAYHWLFVEEENSEERKRNGRQLTGFLTICSLLDLDPKKVRARVRTMTVTNVIHVGRPAEYRRQDCLDEDSVSAGRLSSVGVGHARSLEDSFLDAHE